MLFRYFSTGFIYCLLCFSYQSQAFLQDLYEKCNCENDTFTQRILDKTLEYCPVNEDNPLFCKITNIEDVESSKRHQMSEYQTFSACSFMWLPSIYKDQYYNEAFPNKIEFFSDLFCFDLLS